MSKAKHKPDKDLGRTFAEMQRWFASPAGQSLLEAETALLEPLLIRRFGYHLVQVGCADLSMFQSSPVGHKFSIAPCRCRGAQAIAHGEAIPLASESVDVVLLHHALDFSAEKHQFLREASRILIAGGHMIIVGFNPFSSWGLRHKLSWRREAPWTARLLSGSRLVDWLQLLEFQVDSLHYGLYALPFNSPKVLKYSSLMDSLATKLNWPTGGIYILAAKKQAVPLNPIQTRWREFPVVGLPASESVPRSTRNF